MKRPSTIKDKEALRYIEYLEDRLKTYETSPYQKAYSSLLHQLDAWNQQLTDKNIDLFAESTDKSFDRAHKYFTEQKPYFDQLDYLRKLMTPQELKSAEESRVISESATAEKYIFHKE